MDSVPRPLRVVVVGSLNMDLLVRVPQLPAPGETVMGDSLLQAAGGKGANQAVAAARLGSRVRMVGRVGRDAFGRALSRGLRAEGISTRWVRPADQPTGAALIAVDAHGENCIVVAPGANVQLAPADLPERTIAAAEVVVAQLEVPPPTIAAAFRLARAGGARTVLNAAPAQPVPPDLLALSDVVIANEPELATLLGRQPLAHGAEAAAAHALQTSPEQVVVVTLGPRGALAVGGPAARVLEQPAFAVTAVDSVGAGDAFVGGFVASRWWSAGLEAALRWGCAAGALATTRPGGQPALPTRAAVQALLDATPVAAGRPG